MRVVAIVADKYILVTLADVGLGHLKSMFANFVSASDTQGLLDSVDENKPPMVTRYAILFCEKLNKTKTAKWFDQCNDNQQKINFVYFIIAGWDCFVYTFVKAGNDYVNHDTVARTSTPDINLSPYLDATKAITED